MSTDTPSPAINLQVLEFLSSRICHDLISPVSAVNNGVELFEELGPDAGDEVIGLIASASRTAARKLQLMRLAYGAGGNDPSIRPDIVFDAVQGFLEMDEKVEFTPPEKMAQGPLLGKPNINRVLACCLFLVFECLPRGGKMAMDFTENNITLNASGADARLWSLAGSYATKEQIEAGDTLDPRSIHPFVTGLYARTNGYVLSFSEVAGDEGQVVLSVQMPEQA